MTDLNIYLKDKDQEGKSEKLTFQGDLTEELETGERPSQYATIISQVDDTTESVTLVPVINLKYIQYLRAIK